MLILALKFELRSLLHNWAGLVAALAFLAVGGLAITVGGQRVAQWQDEIADAEEAQASAIEEARGYFDRGESGPEDRPWVDLSEPAWQDDLAGSRIARIPGPLAGIATGAVDPAPAAFRIYRWANPSSSEGYRIENPELMAGTVDLVFVLAVLLPLLVGVLGLGIGTRERESGLDKLIVLQAGSEARWLAGRALAVAAIVGAVAAVLSVGAGVVGGASTGEIASLATFALGYAVLWSGLLLAVNAVSGNVRSAAFGYGAAWTVICLLVPAIATELAFGRLEADFAVAETVDARLERWNHWDRDMESVLPELYALYPDLEDTDRELSDEDRHDALAALETAIKVERHDARIEREEAVQTLAHRACWLSPAVAMTLGLERLARVGPEAASAYRDHVMRATQDRVAWLTRAVWERQPLDASDFEALVAATPSSFEAPRVRLAGPILALLLWAAGVWAVALLLLRGRG